VVSEINKYIKENIPILASIIKTIRYIVKHQLSRIKIRHLLQKNMKICLEVGAGDKKGENGWVTMDLTKNCDIYWDLRKGLPFPNESI